MTREFDIDWIWSDDELDAIGSGVRRVRWTPHPRKKEVVKVYPVHGDSNPVLVSEERFIQLLAAGERRRGG